MNRRERGIALFILLVAAVLRLYRLSDFEFTHDEISALLRTGFPSLDQLLARGVMVEGHPAGVQLLLDRYVRMVGYGEWMVKIPFVIMGLLSLLLVMGTAVNLGRPRAGLLAAATMAVMQHLLIYSQLARPYGPALLFVLGAGWLWTRYFYRGDRHPSVLIGFALSAAAAAYSHQIAMLVVVIMFFHAQFLARGPQRLHWLLAGLGAVFLYLPHFPILLHQLEMGGVGSWLPPPNPIFPLHYAGYLLHYSWLFGAALALVLILLIRRRSLRGFFAPGVWWFVLVLGISYGYSVKVNPLLQFSTLVFVFPFLLLSIFTLCREIYTLPLAALIMVTGSWSLYAEREHYPEVYRSPFAQALQMYQQARAEDPGKKLLLVHNLSPGKLDFYRRRWPVPEQAILYLPPEDCCAGLEDSLRSRAADRVVLALWDARPQELPHRLQQMYPALHRQQLGFHYSLYDMGRKGEASARLPGREAGLLATDTFTKVPGGREFGPAFDRSLEAMPAHPQDYYLIRWEVQADGFLRESSIACALYEGDSLLNWESRPLRSFQQDTGGSFTAWQTFRLPGRHAWWPSEDLRMRVLLHHRDSVAVDIRMAEWSLYRGNRRVYGDVNPF